MVHATLNESLIPRFLDLCDLASERAIATCSCLPVLHRSDLSWFVLSRLTADIPSPPLHFPLPTSYSPSIVS